MYVRSFEEAKCQICKRIFCCAACRQKHKFEAHAITVTQPLTQRTKIVGVCNEIANATAAVSATVYVFCPICEQKPLALHEEIFAELLAHIESVHLPLRCRKCQRNYTRIEDLSEFSKCVNVGQDCSVATSMQNQSCDPNASKVTLKRTTVAASSISTQTSPSITKDMHESQQKLQPQEEQPHNANLTPISLINLRWKAKSRLTQEEFNSDSVSSIRNLSSDSVNLSVQQRLSIGLLTTLPEKGKVIRSTSTPLAVDTMFAKPKDTLTFNGSAVGGAHMSTIYYSGYVLDEQNQVPAPQDSNQLHQQQRPWKIGGRRKISGVTPLRQVMSKSIQKAFVEHGVGILSAAHGAQRRVPLDLSENSPSESSLALDLRISPVVRRSQSVAEKDNQSCGSLSPVEPYQIMLSAQKLTTESITITRTQHCTNNGSLAAASESVEIITTATGEVSANVAVPPITPITRTPGAIINKKLIKFETPQKQHDATQSTPDENEIFYTPNLNTFPSAATADQIFSYNEQYRQQLVPRQLSGEFAAQTKMPQPHGPRARPPLRAYRKQNSFSSVEDLISDDEDEVFLPTNASTHNDKKRTPAAEAGGQSEPGRLWSLMSSVIRLPLNLRTDRSAAIRSRSGSDDKENTATASTLSSGSLIRRCVSIAGSLVRTMQAHDDANMQTLKRKRTQTLDYQYCTQMSPSSSSSKRFRIQPRQPVKRMRNT